MPGRLSRGLWSVWEILDLCVVISVWTNWKCSLWFSFLELFSHRKYLNEWELPRQWNDWFLNPQGYIRLLWILYFDPGVHVLDLWVRLFVWPNPQVLQMCYAVNSVGDQFWSQLTRIYKSVSVWYCRRMYVQELHVIYNNVVCFVIPHSTRTYYSLITSPCLSIVNQ